MSTNRIVMTFAGVMIRIKVDLSQLVSTWWLPRAGFCSSAIMLKRYGIKPGAAF